MNAFLGFNTALWFICVVVFGFFIYKMYKISNSKTISESLIRDKIYITIFLTLFVYMALWIFAIYKHKDDLNKPKDQYPKIVVYDNEREYKNHLGTEIDVNYEGSHLTHIKRTEVKRTPDSDEVMVVITLGFEEEQ